MPSLRLRSCPITRARDLLLADGRHRLCALSEIGAQEVPAGLFVAPAGGDPVAYAYEHALGRSTRSSKPLSRGEKQAAIVRLVSERPTASDREMARIVVLTTRRSAGCASGEIPQGIRGRLRRSQPRGPP